MITPRRVASEIASFYQGLSPRMQRAVLALLAAEAAAIAACERDIQRRPAALIRGPKLLWRIVSTQNIVGPAAYLALGRRRDP